MQNSSESNSQANNPFEVNQEIHQKQEYFRNNIDSEDYETFGQFCLEKKGNHQIDKWSLTEVKELVEMFKVWKEFFILPAIHVKQPGDKKLKIQDLNISGENVEENEEGETKKQQIQNKIVKLDPTVIQIGSNNNNESFSALDLIDLLNNQEPSQILKPSQQNSNDKMSKSDVSMPKKSNQKDSIKQQPLTKIIKIIPIEQNPNKRVSENGRTSEISNNPRNSRTIENPNLNQSMLNKSSIMLNIPKIYKQQFQQVIQCKKSQPINLDRIKYVQIKKHQIVHKAFFLPDYVMYHVQLQPMNIICKRNYEDFTRLNDILKNMYPGIKLPFLESNSWLSETNIEFIKKQKICLEYYLNELIRHQSLKNCLPLYQFLTFTDHKSIKRKFQQYQAAPVPKSIDKLENSQGKQYVRLSNADNYFIKKATDFSKEITDFLAQFNQLGLTLISNYEMIVSTFSSMKRTIQNLKVKTKNFLDLQYKLNFPIDLQIKQLPNVLKILQSICKVQASTLNSKKQLIFQKIFPYTRYQQTNISSIQQLLNKRQNLQDHLLSQIQSQPTSPSTSLTASNPKKNYYLSSELKSYKNGIFELSQNCLVSKYHLGYLNNCVKKEMIQMFEYFGRGLRENVCDRIEGFLGKEKNREYEEYVKLLQRGRCMKKQVLGLEESMVRNNSAIY